MNSLPLRFTATSGALFTALGLLGLAVTGFDNLTAQTGPEVLVFRVNGLLSLAHLIAGGACLAATAFAGDAPARNVTLLCAAAFGTFGLLGLAMLGEAGNILALNTPDTVLHLVTSVVAVGALVMEHTGERRQPRLGVQP